MRIIRYAAAIATIIMSLLNLPAGFGNDGTGVPAAVAWLFSVLGVVGIVAAIGLFRSAGWSGPTVLGVGVVNLVGAVVGLAKGWEGSAIGLVLSLLGAGLAAAYLVMRPAKVARAS